MAANLTDPNDTNLYLTFTLPETVAEGDVAILEEGGSIVGDGLRFGGGINGQLDNQMQFYSLKGGGELADTGFPSNFNTPTNPALIGATENADETFHYDAGQGDNQYYGVSGEVPEPSRIIALLGCAGMGLIGLVWRRRRP